MRKVESLAVNYVGYKSPETSEEINLEILGLKTAIAAAEQRIAVLTQSVALQYMMSVSAQKEPSNEETVEKASESDQAEQKS